MRLAPFLYSRVALYRVDDVEWNLYFHPLQYCDGFRGVCGLLYFAADIVSLRTVRRGRRTTSDPLRRFLVDRLSPLFGVGGVERTFLRRMGAGATPREEKGQRIAPNWLAGSCDFNGRFYRRTASLLLRVLRR